MFGSQGARRRLSFGTGGTLLLTIAVFSAIYLYLERDGLIHFGRFPSLHGNHRCSLKSYTRHGFPVHCQGLYLDVGTNVGTQIRKLYNPELFPVLEVNPCFSPHFLAYREVLSVHMALNLIHNMIHGSKRLKRTFNAINSM